MLLLTYVPHNLHSSSLSHVFIYSSPLIHIITSSPMNVHVSSPHFHSFYHLMYSTSISSHLPTIATHLLTYISSRIHSSCLLSSSPHHVLNYILSRLPNYLSKCFLTTTPVHNSHMKDLRQQWITCSTFDTLTKCRLFITCIITIFISIAEISSCDANVIG